MNKRIINILLLIVILILIALNIIIYIKNHQENGKAVINATSTENTSNGNINYEEENKNAITGKVATINEGSRMQTYFGSFITYIEEEEYEKAYNLLNEDFKNNYFKTIEEFKQYVQKYPENIIVDYQNIDREGEIFVLTVEIKDLYNSQAEAIKQRVVIKENGANDFKISFQVN